MFRAFVAAIGAAVVVLAVGARAETVAGVHLPEQMRLDGDTLALASCGVRDTLWIAHSVAAQGAGLSRSRNTSARAGCASARRDVEAPAWSTR